MRKYIVSSYPFVHSGNDTNKMFLYTTMLLVILIVFGFMFFGVNSLLIAVVSIVSCYLFETIYNILNKGLYFVDNFSFFVTAMILAASLPAKTPILIVIVSAFIAIFVTKMVFGGLGKNKFNPALVGRCFAGVVSSELAVELYNYSINGEFVTSLTAGGTNSIYNLLLGQAVGGVGTTCIVLILFCAIVLIYTGTIDYKIPLFSVLSYFGIGLLFNGVEQNLMNMLSGSFIFVSVFMMTDPNTSPNTFFGKIIYSCLFGGLCALLWNYKVLGENTVFVVALFVNIISVYIDRYVRVKPITLGGFRNAHKV